jgi:hypothetical protein
VNEVQPYVAVAGGVVLFVLGLVSVWRPRAFWGQDLEQLQGKGAEARKRLIRRRWQVGTGGFLITGATFAAIGIWQILGGG